MTNDFKSEASPWTHLYPCSEGCGFIGRLDDFDTGECYQPCPRCGGRRSERTGRFIYQVSTWTFFKEKKFDRVEWRDELKSA